MALIWPPHMRLSWGGTLGIGADDIWSNTIRFHFGGDLLSGQYEPTRDELEEGAVGVEAALRAWMLRQGSAISSGAFLTWIKLNWVKADGHQRDAVTVLREVTGAQGSESSNRHPWQITHALTLRTGIPRGRAHSGRIYPPLTCALVEGAGPYTSMNQGTQMAASLATCIDELAQAISDGVDVPADQVAHGIIVSPGDSDKGTSPISYNITSVVCDLLADTQRRRINAVARLEAPPAAVAQ